MKITVPICNVCNKPHYGRKNVNERCICDSSGQFHYGEIEEEVVIKKDDLLESLDKPLTEKESE